MLNPRFIEYFHETFFRDNSEELAAFLGAIENPIPRTIRIKPEHITQVKTRLEHDGWILGETDISNVFSLDRTQDFDPLERRIGFSLDHLVGNFYIQELAAAHPVDILANHQVQYEPLLILDMASSPGGKTTQLAEYFSRSFIVANEPTRERIPQLLQNLDRMDMPNCGITLYPGQYWKTLPETFDRILLDAPCSGEGTLYKGTDAVKHWHIKNIKQIARLQEKLLDAAVHTLKVGGEMIYSTCALNMYENEGVVDAIMQKYPNTLEILYQKKFWPHVDKTGGFFVTKLRKVASIEYREQQKVRSPNERLVPYRGSLGGWQTRSGVTLYEHDKKILAIKNQESGNIIRNDVFFMRYGEHIGTIENGTFVPNAWAHRHLDITKVERYTLTDEIELDHYLRGESLSSPGPDGWILLEYDHVPIALEQRSGDTVANTFPRDWRRR